MIKACGVGLVASALAREGRGLVSTERSSALIVFGGACADKSRLAILWAVLLILIDIIEVVMELCPSHLSN